jgi:putative MATE family efflux protein
MSRPSDSQDATREVEDRVESLGDPELGPALPSAGLAAHAASGAARRDGRPQRHRTGTTRELWSLSWPAMLSQVLITVVQLVDIAMVGRIGPTAQAAVGYASQFFFLSQSALFAIGFGCVALMARAIGAGDPLRARAALAGSLGLAVVVALLFAVILIAFPETLLGWLSAEPEVAAQSVPYLRLVMTGSILFGVALTLESALRADKDMKTPMRVAAVATVVKLVLNALLIFGLFGFPRLELVGAGLATLGSQLVAVALLVTITARAPRDGPLALGMADVRRARGVLGELVRISLPGVAERLVMNLAILAYFAVLSRYGTAAVAAYTIGVRVLAFSWIPGVGYSQAVGTLVGQSLGAGDLAAAERAGWRGSALSLGTAAVLGVVCVVSRGPLAELFTTDAATIAALGPFMLALGIAQPFLQLHFTLGGAHRGAGDTWTPLIAALVGNWVFRVPLAVVFANVLELPLVWVWGALIFDHVARAGWLGWSFRSGRWRRRA